MGVSALLQILMAAILGRLLTPTAFGLIALANLTLRFVTYFSQAGVAQAVVQKRDLSRQDVQAAFTLSLVLSASFTAVAWFAAPFVAGFVDEPDLLPVLRLMAFHLLISGFGAPASGLLRRAMRFQVLAIVSVGSYLLGYAVVGVSLAIGGAGVYALVAATLTQAMVAMVSAMFLTKPPMRPTRSWTSYRAIFGFGSHVSVIGFFEFLGNELDTLAVGRYAGTAPLGLYNRGYLLVSLPMHQLKSGLSQVLLPALSSIQGETARLRRTYLSAIGVVAGIGMPISAGIAAASEELILVVLGPQWAGAVPVVPWLAIAAACSLVSHFGGVMAEAQGTLKAKLAIVVSKVALLGGFLLLAAGGPLGGYGAALAGAATYGLFAYTVLMSRTLDTRALTILGRLLPGITTAGLVALGITGMRALLQLAEALPSITLLASVLTGGFILAASSRLGPMRIVVRDVRGRIDAADLLETDGGKRRPILGAIVKAFLGSEKKRPHAGPH